MRRKGINATAAIVAVLAVIGFWEVLSRNPYSLLMPIVILGGIFAFYWFSPARRARTIKPRRSSSAAQRNAARPKTAASKKQARKASPFRVIEGGKDEDGMPKYH